MARAKAIVAADMDILSALTDKDYLHVDAAGRTNDKDGFLNALSSGDVSYISYDLKDSTIIGYSDVVIVTGTFENRTAITDAEDRVCHGRHVRIWVRHSQGWCNIFHQGTEIKR